MRRAWLAGVGLGFAVTLPAFWGRDLVGSAGAEVYGHAWVVGFVAEQWPRLPDTTTRLDPDRAVPWVVMDPVVTWTIAGMSKLLGLVAAWDLAACVAVAAAFVGGAFLARRTGGSSMVGGAVTALGPALGAALASGLSEDWGVGLVAAALGGVAALAGRREAVITGVALGLCAWLGLYLALGAAIGAVVLGLARVIETRRWQEMALAAVLALGVASPSALRHGARLGGEHHRFGAPQLGIEPNWAYNPRRGDDVASFVTPWPWRPVDPERPELPPLIRLHPAYLGLIPLGLAALGGRRREWALVGISAALAVGPTIAVAGRPIVANPIVGVASMLPVGHLVNHWGRLLLPGQLAVAVMAARGARRLRESRKIRPDFLATCVAVEAVLLSPTPWPALCADAEIPEIYRSLDALPPGGLIVAPSAGPGVPFQRGLYRSLAQHRPVAIDPDRPGYAWIDATPLADALRGLHRKDAADPDLRRSLPMVRAAGATVLLVEDPYVGQVTAWMGPPTVVAAGGAAWALR
jgi:hypothetical protein